MYQQESVRRGVVLARERNGVGTDSDSGKAEVHHLGAVGRCAISVTLLLQGLALSHTEGFALNIRT